MSLPRKPRQSARLIPPVPYDTILRVQEVMARIGLHRTTLYRLIQAGDFPRPLKLSAGAVGWRASDVALWIASRVNPTDAARKDR